MSYIVIAFAVTLGVTVGQTAQPPDDAVEKGEKALKEFLEKIKGAHGQILRIDASALTELFPNRVFFAVRYRIYPVARQLPEGMKPSNVFVFDRSMITHINDAGKLREFFTDKLPPIRDEAAAKKAAQAWLRLSQEFVQDGFYKFAISDDAIKTASEAGSSKASGKAAVMAGGNGEVNVEMVFKKDGKLGGLSYQSQVKAGPRPICQATKLLDADPVVRRMAEQDLLYMGLAARDYLEEQRTLAAPELRQAIDRLWRQIEKEGW
jgi:hypothetical protein